MEVQKAYFRISIIIFIEVLVILKKCNIFAESCLMICKAQNFNAVTLSLNRYQQFSTSLFTSIIQIDTEKFLIISKDWESF